MRLPLWSALRFTPTCMGNTFGVMSKYRLIMVHPHMHGEYIIMIILNLLLNGSPPHAWGIPHVIIAEIRHLRFTPTCMGNTLVSAGSANAPAVHPHMHGEYRDCPCHNRCPEGSPPHAWGIPKFMLHPRVLVRFTPTCMGNTLDQ